MAISIKGKTAYSPAIITDGLVLCLDAANRQSYPGSETVWRDLAGSNNGTLTNGPTFSGANGGSLVFDGVDDYVNNGSVSVSSGKITVNVWIRISTGFKLQHIVDSSLNSWHLALLNTNRPYFYNGSTYHTNTSVLDINSWYMITGVQGSALNLYINGVISQSIASNLNVTTNNLNIGRWQNSSGREFKGDIANIYIYNRALTPAEILQNYNATKGRFLL